MAIELNGSRRKLIFKTKKVLHFHFESEYHRSCSWSAGFFFSYEENIYCTDLILNASHHILCPVIKIIFKKNYLKFLFFLRHAESVLRILINVCVYYNNYYLQISDFKFVGIYREMFV